jgi:hypothetical protein
MATIGEDWSKTAAEVAQATQEAARRYMDESTSFGRATLRTWTAATHAGMGVAFLQQNAMVQVARTMAEANAQASRDWLNQTTDTLRMAQDATSKLVSASSELVDSMVGAPRG